MGLHRKKNVLITGGSKGIGKAIVSNLKKQGYNVYSPTRHELDLLSDISINSYIKKNKSLSIDILINNAGINNPQWIEEVSDENIEQTIQTNLIAPIKLTRGFVSNMKKNKWGKIVNISSIFGIVARGKQTLYTTTKHGLNGLTQALALELAPHNILVNSVCPGFAKTELVLRNPVSKIKQIEQSIPLGRLGMADEIADLVSFLVSDKNTYMTGSVIPIDGGFTSQ